MDISQKLFNRPPAPNARRFVDRSGRHYWLVWQNEGNTAVIDLWYRGEHIGHLFLQMRSPDIVLVDIVIERRQHRKRGLGTLLLCEVIEYAKQIDARAITGLISKNDLAATVGLVSWYERQGFQVNYLQDNHWAAVITLSIIPAQIS